MYGTVPTRVFITKGVGTHKEKINARDAASEDAGVENANLTEVSSILPPGVKFISRDEFTTFVRNNKGILIPAVHKQCESNEPGQKVIMGIGIANPWDKSLPGYITEIYWAPGIQDDIMEERLQKSTMQLFARRTGAKDFIADEVWEKGRVTYNIGGNKAEIETVIATGICNMDGDYTCALVLACFLP